MTTVGPTTRLERRRGSSTGTARRLHRRLDPHWWRGPVPVTLLVAAVLHLLWGTVLASSGGDIAAQDAWAEFARAHPGIAYNLEWYGGIHTVSYSVISPYVMALAGVRPTMVVAGTVSSGLVAWLLVRSGQVRRPTVPAVYGAFALFGNAISGRVTFALGVLFALTASWLTVLGTEQDARRTRNWMRAGVGLCGAAATAASPVAGMFLGLLAAALWLLRRRADACALGVPPVVVVGLSALLFPFSGEEPMRWSSAILPFIVPLAVVLLAPRAWRTVRATSAVYAVAVLAAWLLPSPVGTNVVRMGLLFGGTVLVAVLTSRGWEHSWWDSWWRQRRGHRHPQALLLLVMALTTSTLWQAGVAGLDAVHSRPSTQTEAGLTALVAELEARQAELGRIEVVPTRSHREAAALAPYVALARGWNRQADVGRNPLFYKRDVITADAYHRWLRRWAVSYVVLGSADPDPAAKPEALLVASHPDYLHEVWSDGDWTLYSVSGSKPLVDSPAQVTGFNAAVMTIMTPAPGTFTVRIPTSPWLALVDAEGRPLSDEMTAGACLSALLDAEPEATAEPGKNHPNWVVLHAPTAGTYRISAPYKLPRGSSCV